MFLGNCKEEKNLKYFAASDIAEQKSLEHKDYFWFVVQSKDYDLYNVVFDAPSFNPSNIDNIVSIFWNGQVLWSIYLDCIKNSQKCLEIMKGVE